MLDSFHLHREDEARRYKGRGSGNRTRRYYQGNFILVPPDDGRLATVRNAPLSVVGSRYIPTGGTHDFLQLPDKSGQ